VQESKCITTVFPCLRIFSHYFFYTFYHQNMVSMFKKNYDWFIDWLTDWLIDSLIDCLDRVIDQSTDCWQLTNVDAGNRFRSWRRKTGRKFCTTACRRRRRGRRSTSSFWWHSATTFSSTCSSPSSLKDSLRRSVGLHSLSHHIVYNWDNNKQPRMQTQ